MLKMSAPRPVFGPKERSLSAPSPGFWAEGPVLRDKMLLQSVWIPYTTSLDTADTVP